MGSTKEEPFSINFNEYANYEDPDLDRKFAVSRTMMNGTLTFEKIEFVCDGGKKIMFSETIFKGFDAPVRQSIV